jgi:hypothetical protein
VLKLARTNLEAHYYMARQPCTCGAVGFTGAGLHGAVATMGDDLISRYTGTCAGCGAPRQFEFQLPETVLPPPRRGVRFGGDEPSQLFDPGEWMALADEHARAVPADGGADSEAGARSLAIAAAAIDEILKFVPASADACPADAFASPRGRAVYDAEPGRFRRARLEAMRGALTPRGDAVPAD